MTIADMKRKCILCLHETGYGRMLTCSSDHTHYICGYCIATSVGYCAEEGCRNIYINKVISLGCVDIKTCVSCGKIFCKKHLKIKKKNNLIKYK